MVKYDKNTLERLINGKLPWNELRPIISGRKDPLRFDDIMEILQEKVPWNEKQVVLEEMGRTGPSLGK